MTGAEFWRLVSEPSPAWTAALAQQLEPPEFRYDVDRGGRFNRTTGIAPIAAVCLPTAVDDPDRLYGELEAAVPSFPVGRIGAHYRRLLAWLAFHLGRPSWIERSGGSLRYCGEIAAHFGESRFVHLYGTGTKTALSMSRHPYFRMAMVREALRAAVGFDPYESGARAADIEATPPELRPLLPQNFNAAALRAYPIPVERFGRRWSAEIIHGITQLDRLPAGSVHHHSLAALLRDPEESLIELFRFFEVRPPSAWSLAAMVSRLRSTPPPRSSLRLSPGEARELERACEPGEARIRALAE